MTDEQQDIEIGTMIRKPFKGNRISIMVVEKTHNQAIQQLLSIMDRYKIKGDLVFHHYGRPRKCKKEFDEWAEKYLERTSPLIQKLRDADEALTSHDPLFKPGQSILEKMKRADDILLGKTKI